MKIIMFLSAVYAIAQITVSCDKSPNMAIPGAGSKYSDPPAPVFISANVHDPSVFPASENNFYVIGSHLASAKTTDFIQWQQVTQDWNGRRNKFYPEDNPNPSVQKMQSQIDDVMRGAKNALGFFAGDIHLMPDNKFYHYYCITSSWYCSAIGLAIADKVDGPYITQGLIARSGEAADGSMTPDGTTGKWSASRYPNCIDPQAFFDKDNANFYLVYGSWSGGIFILELDPKTGMKKESSDMNDENGGYGRKLIRNNHVSIEGPYIIYSPESNYYYLFVSYGGLAANGGYNMRVFRSRDPCGPYDDAAHPGQDMGNDLKYSEYVKYGVKIMGGYKFARSSGKSSDASAGYLSPGHNSVYYNHATGQYFLIYHQRFERRGEYHEIRVCEMFLNEDAWFAAAPFRYDGGIIRKFTPKDLSGVWNLINHGIANNTTPVQSVAYQFMKNGKITSPSASSGTWELGSDGQTAHITLDGILYKGVFLRCYDEDAKKWVQAFTALSQDGIALWGAGAAEI
jgi:arabinan endo-1,5-alpha-L-arabinosidase